MILYPVFPLIYLINVIFFYQPLQNYISLGVTELFFLNWDRKLLFPLRRPLLQNLMDPTPKPYGSNSKNFKICYPPLVRVQYKIQIQNLTTFFGMLPFNLFWCPISTKILSPARSRTLNKTKSHKFCMKDGRKNGRTIQIYLYKT